MQDEKNDVPIAENPAPEEKVEEEKQAEESKNPLSSDDVSLYFYKIVKYPF